MSRARPPEAARPPGGEASAARYGGGPTPSAIGWKAHAALSRSAGRWTTFPGFAGSDFRIADGEPIWIGQVPAAMHPRAVLLDPWARHAGSLCVDNLAPWREAPSRLAPPALAAARASSILLASRIRDLGEPRGFAALLAGERPPFPLHGIAPRAAAVASAIDRDDAKALHDAALPLLGLGPGLTPSGDDFVGAVLYARGLAPMDEAWSMAVRGLVDAARTRTHAIAAALFADLVQGESFAALRRLVRVLAAPIGYASTDAAARTWPLRDAAREVVAIGHSSGWDMLAGLVIGCSGSAGLSASHAAVDSHRGKRCA